MEVHFLIISFALMHIAKILFLLCHVMHSNVRISIFTWLSLKILLSSYNLQAPLESWYTLNWTVLQIVAIHSEYICEPVVLSIRPFPDAEQPKMHGNITSWHYISSLVVAGSCCALHFLAGCEWLAAPTRFCRVWVLEVEAAPDEGDAVVQLHSKHEEKALWAADCRHTKYTVSLEFQ